MSSNCGSSFGLYLKKAGYDALILSGRCRKPGKATDSVLNDLGIDSIDAHKRLSWLPEKHGVTLENSSGNKP